MMKKPICISVAGLFILSFIGYAVAQTDSNLMSLDFPEGITVDTDGNVYVADTNNNRIQKFDSDGNFLAKWGSLGTNDREFSLPEGIAVDADGNVYVADRGNHRIQKFTSDGTFLSKWGANGNNDGQFAFPHGIAIHNNSIYVADTNNNRIQKFDSDGNFLAKWGAFGTNDGEFVFPHGVAVDNNGNIYVADTLNYRTQKFDSDGKFLLKWGARGTNDGEFEFPHGIAIHNNSIYVADTNNNRIQKFDSDGNFLAKWGSLGTNDREFSLPEGIAVDADGNVYVADTNNNRIQKFDGMGNTIALSEGGMEETVEKVTVEYQDSTFDVPLSLSNGSVVSIEVDPDFTSVILTLEPGEEDGKLSITLPRALIDSKMDGSDDMFVVLADGDDVEYEETDTTDTERVLTIPVSAGVSEIEIVGTQVVPEFPLGMIILMGSITIAMVIMRLNGRLKFNW